jgi:hypothetical protein
MKNRASPLQARILFLITLVGAAFVSLPSTQAATITVTNTNDSGTGSFSWALFVARDGDRIGFAIAGRILVPFGLVVDNDVTISGPGAHALALDAERYVQDSRPILSVFGSHVHISGLTIANGSRFCRAGGGIYVGPDTELTLTNCVSATTSQRMAAGSTSPVQLTTMDMGGS